MAFAKLNNGTLRPRSSGYLKAHKQCLQGIIEPWKQYAFFAYYDEQGKKMIDDHILVALTIMIAESRPEEKEMMISVIMNYIG